jgi:hypothetical protein
MLDLDKVYPCIFLLNIQKFALLKKILSKGSCSPCQHNLFFLGGSCSLRQHNFFFLMEVIHLENIILFFLGEIIP